VPLRGVRHRLKFLGAGSRNGVVRPSAPDGAAGAQPLPVLEISGGPAHAPRRLRDWLEAEARKDLDERVRWHAANIGVRPRALTLRDQKSRWGSCSSTGRLSFSWRLILAPPPVLDYVAAHEVAHLVEMNHGARFWRLVKRTMPDMDKARMWLRENGTELHRYGLDE
jgi:predicted metal-dependent hydrolase